MASNVDSLKRFIEAYNARDLTTLLDLCDPDIEFRSIFATLESGGAFRGTQGVHEYFAAIDGAYDRFTLHPAEFIDAGAAVVMLATAEWSGLSSGAANETPVFPVCWFRAGKVLRIETFTSKEDALEAAGVS